MATGRLDGPVTMRLLGSHRGDCEMAHEGEAGKCLSPEAQRSDALKVLKLLEL